MGDAQNKGGRGGERALWSGREKQRPPRDYSENWLEHKIRDLHGNVVDEPVPREMLDIVKHIPVVRAYTNPR